MVSVSTTPHSPPPAIPLQPLEGRDLSMPIDNQPLSIRREPRKRRIPARFGKNSDMLPSAQMAAISIYSQIVTPEGSPEPVQHSSPSITRSTSPAPMKPIIHETTPNEFGIYRHFSTLPSVDREGDNTLDDLVDAPFFANETNYSFPTGGDTIGRPINDGSSNQFFPYLNASVYRLMNWFYQTGLKSLADLNSLVHDVVLAPDFDPADLNDFDASRESKRLDDDPLFPELDGWKESSVKIPLPQTFAKYRDEDAAPKVEIPGVFHRDLLQSIVSAFKDSSFETFHLKGFTQLWRPSDDEPVEEIYGEAYSSQAFREMEEEIQSMKPPGETLENIVVPIMAYSDSTHLTSFGTASLWPIYFFIGLTSKYVRTKPTTFSAHHLAYIPSVSIFYLLVAIY